MPVSLRIALPLALVALAAAPAGARSPALASCRSQQLSGTVGSSGGAAGTILLAVVLRNRAQTRCSLRGYPALRLYRPHRWLPTAVRHGGLVPLQRPVRTIVLAPAQRATVFVAYNDVPRGDAPCLTATTLFVRPPGTGGDGVPVNVRAMACAGLLRESPFVAGARQAPRRAPAAQRTSVAAVVDRGTVPVEGARHHFGV